MNFFERTQVPSSLAGVPKWERRPKIWERLCMLEKRLKGRARSRCLLRGPGPDSFPSGWELAQGEGELGGALPAAGMFFGVSLKGAAALPAAFLFWPSEFCLVGQRVPKGGSVPPGTSTGGKGGPSWPYQTCCKLASGAQDDLTFPIAPPDVVSERPTSDHEPQSSASVLCPQDVRRRCMIATAVLMIVLPLGLVFCCFMIRRRRKRKQ